MSSLGGLGTLAILPFEVRNAIFGYLGPSRAVFCYPWDQEYLTVTRKLVRCGIPLLSAALNEEILHAMQKTITYLWLIRDDFAKKIHTTSQNVVDSIQVLELDLRFDGWGDFYPAKHWKRRRRERQRKLATMSDLVANLLDRVSSSTVRPKSCTVVLHEWCNGDDEIILMEPNSPFMKALCRLTGFEEVFIRVSVSWARLDHELHGEDYTLHDPLAKTLNDGLEQTLGEGTISPFFVDPSIARVPLFCMLFHPRKFAESSKKRIEEA